MNGEISGVAALPGSAHVPEVGVYVIFLGTCLFILMVALWPSRLGKWQSLDKNDLRRVRRMSDRVHADERLPHE